MMDQTGKVQIVIQRGAHVFNPTKQILDKVKNDLTFKNPKYENAKRYGLYASVYMDATLSYFSYNREKNILYIPRGYIFYFIRFLKEQDIPYEYSDRTTLKNQIGVVFSGKPRDYQEKALKQAIRYPGGVIESGTGSGKTFMGINMIAIRKQPTLVIVHTKELLYQWQERIKQFLDYNCGIVGDGKFEVKDITVGIVQSVQNKIEILKDRFGHIICDECHRTSASTWVDILDKTTAKYLLGLSATAYRNDGLGSVMNAFIGPKIHVVDKEVLHESGAVLKPVVYRIETGFYAFFESYTKLIGELCASSKRNALIAKNIAQDLNQYSSQVLVASDRVQHCYDVQEELRKLKIESVVLSAATPKKERKQIVEDVNSGKQKVLISTVQLIGEGFDAPNIHALFVVTPIKYKGRLLQIAGRVLRPEKGKTARIYDFRDDSIKMLQRMATARDVVYRKQWGRNI